MGKRIIDGYSFENSKDERLATKEQNVISKISESLDMSNADGIYETYNRLVSKHYFTTPVGIGFLHEMRDYLKQFYGEDQLMPISIRDNKSQQTEAGFIEKNYKQFEKIREENNKLKRIKRNLTVALVAMIVVIIGMMFIVVTNDNLGYFNAEEKILNKYAAWQERLDGWEKELMLREEQLGR